jgi:GAF domain-containing protein
MSDMMPLAEELSRVYARMSGLLLSDETVQTALGLVTALALETIPGAIGAGVTLLGQAGTVDGQERSSGSTSALVARADELQYQLGEGPCLTACEQDVLVRIDDLEQDLRWPRWRAEVLPLGLRSSLSAPLDAQGPTSGALKVYGDHPEAFDQAGENLLTRFAEQAAILLANVTALDQAERLSESLQRALRTRNLVALATGVLMERHHLTEESAFLRLVGISRRQQRDLADGAATVVSSTSPEDD